MKIGNNKKNEKFSSNALTINDFMVNVAYDKQLIRGPTAFTNVKINNSALLNVNRSTRIYKLFTLGVFFIAFSKNFVHLIGFIWYVFE